ncbi:MAG: AbrB/MazE/SpoVT family DNA-binding domain-containing protein [Clostridiales bacterium]|jgi:bifunctional DNA-binding transcriptional regulator/antitoxin component of YhaV-PrlF toxin-antitoxin module|nr:AbrB/MazE/SpoVT family DNA-binding domain-containing protein [Clostridiales bacterium]
MTAKVAIERGFRITIPKEMAWKLGFTEGCALNCRASGGALILEKEAIPPFNS